MLRTSTAIRMESLLLAPFSIGGRAEHRGVQGHCKAERMLARKYLQDHLVAQALARRRALEFPGSVRERDSSADTN